MATEEFGWSVTSMVGFRSWQQNLDRDYKGVQNGINTLLPLVERLKYDAEPSPVQPEAKLPHLAKLKVSHADAENVLGKHFNEGEALRAKAAIDDTILLREEELYNKWRLDQKRWNERTKAALLHVYADNDAAEEFYRYAEPQSFGGGYDAWQQNFEGDYEDVGKALNVLMSLTERLRYDDAPERSPSAAPQSSSGGSKDPVVFIVHGLDTGFRETVARWLEKEGSSDLEVVILDEQPDRGRTVLEKLEDHADESVYAVVLFTGDDNGAVKGSENIRPRARQNVVFEFGWFCGLIGRENVGVIFPPDVELPSDLSGLVYIPMTEWEKKLRRELKASGLAF